MFTEWQDHVEKPGAWLVCLVLLLAQYFSKHSMFPLWTLGFPGPLVLNLSSKPLHPPSL